MGPIFEWTWKIVQWPIVFALVTLGIALIYYFAPDAEQDWAYITPGSLLATVLWLLVSLVFKFYIANFTSYTATYGIIGGAIVLMLWFYVSALAVLVRRGDERRNRARVALRQGAGREGRGEKRKIGPAAERAWARARPRGLQAGASRRECDVDADLLPAPPARRGGPRFSDWVVAGVVVAKRRLTRICAS
jgi:membrane protein